MIQWPGLLRICALAGILGVLRPFPGEAAETLVMTPSKDNTLFQSEDGSLSNGAGIHLFAGRNNDLNVAKSLRRALLAFDLAGIPAGATITRVSLSLYVSRTRTGGQRVEVHRLLRDWGEGTSVSGSTGRRGGMDGDGAQATEGDATWIHAFSGGQAWDRPGGDFADEVSAATSVGVEGSRNTWESTPRLVADVQGWLDDPQSNFGWILIGEENRRSAKRFDSRENPEAANRPLLSIEFEMPTAVGEMSWGRVKRPLR